MADNKSTFSDRMNYTGAIETDDLMTKEERAKFEKMSAPEQLKFLEATIYSRLANTQL